MKEELMFLIDFIMKLLIFTKNKLILNNNNFNSMTLIKKKNKLTFFRIIT